MYRIANTYGLISFLLHSNFKYRTKSMISKR